MKIAARLLGNPFMCYGDDGAAAHFNRHMGLVAQPLAGENLAIHGSLADVQGIRPDAEGDLFARSQFLHDGDGKDAAG